MPKRTDIKTILIPGSGPIVIGQGCEFDYSGTQACKALRAEGYRIVLVNSNPATIMTDPEFSDRTYIEPITPDSVRKILERQRELGDPIQALLPTLGGQTALNCACALYDNGTLREFGIAMIGASREVIHRAEDRELFRRIVEDVGLKMAPARTVTTLQDAEEFLEVIGLPAIIRPAFTLGGSGGGIAYNREEFVDIVTRGLRASMIGQVQIDKSLLGWKEYELEVVRDKKDNCVIVCGIENIDPMGVHTGDSITVAPILTLTDKEYQAMRDAAIAIMRAVGVETGGSNVQFAVNPAPRPGPDGNRPFEMVVVEMNPRVSRSSALASKATGFPIAKIAAKLAVGYTLDELRNDITGTTSACFEPSIDYVVTKVPRWAFEKFPEADQTLTTQMKSVGEAMAIGRTFLESLQKAIRSMEVKRFGLGLDRNDKWLAAARALEGARPALDANRSRAGASPDGQPSFAGLKTADGQALEWPIPDDKLRRKLSVPSQGRLYYVRYALKMGWSVARVSEISRIDPFFVDQIARLVDFEETLQRHATLAEVPREVLRHAKQFGYSDAQLANFYLGSISTETILEVRAHRKRLGIDPVYKLVDTCAAEFEAATPYYYSSYESPSRRVEADGRVVETPAEDEVRLGPRKKIVIIGGGPNRIGQGIEFDYCCVHASFAARELGFESVMINSNPETVSTDYDTSDLLFFEPLTLEDVLNVVERLNGQPLKAQGESAAPAARPPFSADDYEPQAGGDERAVPRAEEGARHSGLVHGLVVQFGGQTPLNLAHGLARGGAPIIGTSLDSIDLAEDRNRFDALLERLGLMRPASGIARTLEEAVAIAGRVGYPVLVRPSYVLGGRGMEICPDERALRHFMANAVDISELDNAPVLIDHFLDRATEIDVDVVADFIPGKSGTTEREGNDGTRQPVVCGVMEHVEHAGIHSGDSSCAVPPWSLAPRLVERIRQTARVLAAELRVNGLMNVQMAIKDDDIYILEVNPRASRTAPFVGKATHVSWPRLAAKVMMGKTLKELGAKEVHETGAFAVKVSVFPFAKFPGVDVVLGPEMRSTGEVMGIDVSFPLAYAKALLASGIDLPREGGVFLSVRDGDQEAIVPVARSLMAMGFQVYATDGSGAHLSRHGLRPRILQKIASGARPNVLDLMSSDQIALVINTPTKTGWQTDEGKIRATAVRLGIPMLTTVTAAAAAVGAIEALRAGDWGVAAIQDYKEMAKGRSAMLPTPQTVR
ncbi:MAG: carbamoyl-phosphate synthase large subunit [Phycisphaerae bacterium]|nr:carbamoyl-phosphate synthase large subunit [Phycisphaerae bacterium]